ncbi:MAG: DUF2298 domain-containing protein [Candidatus Doudnabacteria bacterium]|nr:DUF2298 domain-containing protein [Candidatus Doudnabacteria bacterium]
MDLIAQYSQAFLFYFVFSLFGLLGLVLTIRIFGGTAAAYLTGKIIGLAVFGYAVWLLVSLRIINFQNFWLVVVLFAAALLAAVWFSRGELRKLDWDKILLYELATLALYFAYLFLRSYNPQIFGTEKFMDMAMLTGSGKTGVFPFADPWYAGKAVNYYYYGYYLMALLARLSNTGYALAYNFSLALIFCQVLLLSFVLVLTLTGSRFFSALASFFVGLAGPAIYGSCVLRVFFSNASVAGQCFYPMASRFGSPAYVINELPSYSFIVADLHPHVLSLPFFLAGLIVLWHLLGEPRPKTSTMLAGLALLGTNAVINPPNFPTLGGIFALIFFVKAWQIFKDKKYSWKAAVKDRGLRAWFFWAVGLAAGSFILFAPFFLQFKSFVTGIGFAPSFAAAHNLFGAASGYPTPFGYTLGLWAVFAVFIIVAGYLLFRYGADRTLVFEWILVIVSAALIIFAELFFYEDLFHIANPPYFRANTVFKSDYQAWILLAVAASGLLAAGWKRAGTLRARANRYVGRSLVAAAVFFGLIFSGSFFWQGIVQAYAQTWPAHGFNLDGSVFLEQSQSAGDYRTVQWLNQNQKQRVVILEASGASYQYFGRISVFTGMIDPINWYAHEWTWRFAYPPGITNWHEAVGKSIDTGYGAIAAVGDDVKKMYESADSGETQSLLKKYNVQFVYIGDLERTTYPDLNEAKFQSLGQVVFSYENSELFKINGGN